MPLNAHATDEAEEARLAVVTGASTGIGLELAKLAAREGYDLIIAADEPAIADSASALSATGVDVIGVEADLARIEGVDRLLAAIGDRDVDLLFANAGRGLGRGFLDQDFASLRHVVDTNVTGTLYLVHALARRMVARGEGRILFTGSIAGFMPGTFQAVYNGTKAFIDSFAIALRHELADTGVSVTLLMPGPTDTRFFVRADMLDTPVGQQEKDDPADVARTGFEAMMAGEEQVVSGWKNKLQVAGAHLMPAGRLAEQHRKLAEPGRDA
ncbi:SDR family NAD(P)-dependent oxidoreductase [Prosthecomicrobium pneumaticum]|uniref:Short-subunit dehydrogenase n=1 Tax=Prosthecomicrobium pneumaticum TaxID=81895 RepID=A0A7W9CUC2_9HYPH|nr:SDR family NAD(P)-dependent oxidoreductase [Prosthecomicrobium pneumaticum]MBB5751532.1 short-subunit dehydrogenase [Prosthecomicrobium pneumaticum]